MKLNERSVAHYATCDSPPDKTGFLFKKGERNTAYHRRWFVLKGNMFFYFEDRDSREPIGVIVLEGCTVELCESVEEFAFAIKFDCAKSKVYKLVAENQASMESWVKALSRASFDYMRLVVKELERQLEEIQEAAGGGVGDGQQGRPRPALLNQMVQSRSASSFLSSSASSLSSSSSTPSMTTPQMAQKSHQEEVQLISKSSKENGVIWTKPPASWANGSGEGAPSCAVWEGSADSGAPPVPPRRRGASLESPVSPGTGCFSKLHECPQRSWWKLDVKLRATHFLFLAPVLAAMMFGGYCPP